MNYDQTEIIKDNLDVFQNILGNRITFSEYERKIRGRDELRDYHKPPDAVAFVHNTKEISQILKICNQNKIPVVAFGAGTSLEGNVIPVRGGLCVDLSQMNKVINLNQDDMDCRVEAGVKRIQLNEYLKDSGLFFPVDPGADATIGGMTSTRASGTNSVRYGTMRNNVLNLTAVLADGTVIQTAKRAKKSAAGYDLTSLLIGAEGTLAIISEIQLRLFPVPQCILAARCNFDKLDDACRTVIETIQNSVPITRIELLDKCQIDVFNSYSGYEMPIKHTLFLEFHATHKEDINAQVKTFEEIAKFNNAENFKKETTNEARNKLWKARHQIFWACKAKYPQKDALVTDVCVPISKLAECINETHRDIQELQLTAPITGHVGDGNFHVIVMYDKNNPIERKNVELFATKLVERAINADGTCTGEHGIGIGKKKFLLKELGEAVNVMKTIKKSLDPNNILNPDKIFEMS